MGDTVWDGVNRALFKTPELKNYQPWRNVVRNKWTCTTDMCVALDVQEENHSGPIYREVIAQALQKGNLLRVTESIQRSPNGRFCSINLTTTQIMSTFCSEPLTISENINIVFKPDYKPPQTRAFIFISLSNVSFETEEKEMTRYVKEYCVVHEYTTQNKTLQTLPTIPEREYIDGPT